MISILKYPYDGTYLKGVDAVHQIIKMRIETPLRDIFYNRKTGSQIDSILFEQNDTILEALVNTYVEDALIDMKYFKFIEARIVNNVSSLLISIDWQFRDKNTRTTNLEISKQ
ncbi:MAG: hypothetical protein OHK0045_21890 [Raineya sp.]